VTSGKTKAANKQMSFLPGLPDYLFSNQKSQFWSTLEWIMLNNFMAIWNILGTLGIFYDNLVHFMLFWYIFSGFGIMYLEKSGNPASDSNDVFSFWLLCGERTSQGNNHGNFFFGKESIRRGSIIHYRTRVAIFFLVQHTKTEKIYQMTTKYTKGP
jgi:hypothetical protein